MAIKRHRTPSWAKVTSDTAKVICPFCSEPLSLPIDQSAGSRQSFEYDCEVCCKPIVVSLELTDEGVSVDAARES